jgi:hypothetical protein
MYVTIRVPIAAGSFYNLDVDGLKKQIDQSFNHKFGPKSFKQEKMIAGIVPHAGYEYSGAVAAWVYSRIERANYIILGPNHTGMGSNFALVKAGIWKTPLGGVVVNENVAEQLLKECKILEYDILAHEHEHSIEVQLPFLQHRFGNDFKFVPISIMNEFADENLLESCKFIGKKIGGVIKKQKEKWIVLASSDFSHYVPQELAAKNDKYAIKAIQKLDEKEFFDRINERNVTICGYGPIAATIAAAKELGAKKVELLSYKTSGDMSGDLSAVVGYSAIRIY